LGNTGRVIHEPADFIEKPVCRLHHCRLRSSPAKLFAGCLLCARTMAMVRRSRKGPGAVR
jgi:hypothetical protein